MNFGAAGVDYELFLLQEGMKSVVKRERVPVSQVDAMRERLAGEGLHVACDLALTYDKGATDHFDLGDGEDRFRTGGFATVFIARDAATAARGGELTGLEARRDSISIEAANDATSELGRLLGYPACCVAAFANGVNTPTFQRGTAGFYLDGFHRTAGPFHPLLNRFGLDTSYISHAPCTYGCAPSIAMAERVHAEVARRAPDVAAANEAKLRRPVLFWTFDERVAFDVDRRNTPSRYGALAYRGFEPSRAGRGKDDVFGAFLALLEKGDALTVDQGCVRVFSKGARIGAALDLAPMSLPFLFDWDETSFPYDRAPHIACLDTRTSEHDFFDNRLAVLAGDLRRQGVRTGMYHLRVDHSDTPEARERVQRVAARVAASGATIAVVSRYLSEPLMKALGDRGVARVVLQASGNEPDGTVDYALAAKRRDTRSEGRAQGRIPSLRAMLGLVERGPHEPIAAVADVPDALAADLRVHAVPYEPVVDYDPLDDEPAPLPEQWFFAGNAGCPFSKKYTDPNAASYLPVVRGEVSLRGCNFCEMGGDYARVEWKRDLGPRLAADMEWVRQRAPTVRRLVLGDTYPHPYLGELVGALRAKRARGFELLIQTRSDWLLRTHSQLVDILPQMAEMDAQLVVYLIGFENFSQAELDRMDKDIRVQQNFDAIDLLRELETKHPSAFSATKYHSHGFLLFNPWTTMDDLAENAQAIRAKRFHDFRSNLLMTRLRLYPYLPAFHKARSEGLVTATYDRPEKSSSRWVGYAPEQPWRSKDPRVDRVFDLVSAFRDPLPEGQADLIELAVAHAMEHQNDRAPQEELIRDFKATHAERFSSKQPRDGGGAGNGSGAGSGHRGQPNERGQVSVVGPSEDEVRVWTLLREERLDEAHELATAMVAANPGSQAGQQVLGRVAIQRLFREGVQGLGKRDFVTAERAFRRVRELSPDDAEAARCLARALWERGEREEAHLLYARYCEQKGLGVPVRGQPPR